jgi:hypothetical protein
MFRSYQFLVKVKATSTGKLLDSMLRNNGVAEMCSGKFNVAYCKKIPTPNYNQLAINAVRSWSALFAFQSVSIYFESFPKNDEWFHKNCMMYKCI